MSVDVGVCFCIQARVHTSNRARKENTRNMLESRRIIRSSRILQIHEIHVDSIVKLTHNNKFDKKRCDGENDTELWVDVWRFTKSEKGLFMKQYNYILLQFDRLNRSVMNELDFNKNHMTISLNCIEILSREFSLPIRLIN